MPFVIVDKATKKPADGHQFITFDGGRHCIEIDGSLFVAGISQERPGFLDSRGSHGYYYHPCQSAATLRANVEAHASKPLTVYPLSDLLRKINNSD